MARIGMHGMKYGLLVTTGAGAETTYEASKEFKGAISADISPNNAEAKLHYDNTLGEYASAFQDATITLTAADDTDDVFADLLGRTQETLTGRWRTNINDKVPYIGFGYIVSKIVSGANKYGVVFFPKMKFKPFVPSASTKGESLEFNTISVEGQILANKYGDWESHIEVVDLVEATAELDKYFTEPLSDPAA